DNPDHDRVHPPAGQNGVNQHGQLLWVCQPVKKVPDRGNHLISLFNFLKSASRTGLSLGEYSTAAGWYDRKYVVSFSLTILPCSWLMGQWRLSMARHAIRPIRTIILGWITSSCLSRWVRP